MFNSEFIPQNLVKCSHRVYHFSNTLFQHWLLDDMMIISYYDNYTKLVWCIWNCVLFICPLKVKMNPTCVQILLIAAHHMHYLTRDRINCTTLGQIKCLLMFQVQHVLRSGIAQVKIGLSAIHHTLFGLVDVLLMFPVLKKILLSKDRMLIWCYLESRCTWHFFTCAYSFPFFLFLEVATKGCNKKSKDRGVNANRICQMRHPCSLDITLKHQLLHSCTIWHYVWHPTKTMEALSHKKKTSKPA